jgi:hypothetical protein
MKNVQSYACLAHLTLLFFFSSPSAENAISPAHQQMIESAYRSDNLAVRRSILIETVRTGTDTDVLRSIGAYFPDQSLKVGIKSGICKEVGALLVSELQSAVDAGADKYMEKNGERVRDLIAEAIGCIHSNAFLMRRG